MMEGGGGGGSAAGGPATDDDLHLFCAVAAKRFFGLRQWPNKVFWSSSYIPQRHYRSLYLFYILPYRFISCSFSLNIRTVFYILFFVVYYLDIFFTTLYFNLPYLSCSLQSLLCLCCLYISRNIYIYLTSKVEWAVFTKVI